MKHKVLLIDNSLTVQKVVSLSLDRGKYQVSYAATRDEAARYITEVNPELVLVSDHVAGIHVSSFPKEVETWLGRVSGLPVFILITSEDIHQMRHYHGVLRKPFAPESLREMVTHHLEVRSVQTAQTLHARNEDLNHARMRTRDQGLEKVFKESFADESTLVEQTYRLNEQRSRQAPPRANSEPAGPLWETAGQKGSPQREHDNLWGDPDPDLPATERPRRSPKSPAVSESELSSHLSPEILESMVDRIVAKVVPPIVEKVVRERLDELLKDQEVR